MKDEIKTTTLLSNPNVLCEYSIQNFIEPTESARVVPLSETNPLTEENIRDIVAICNQEAVYELLFREKLNGDEYKVENAQSFVTWANKGWKEGSYFVFVIKDQNGKVIGAVDIKSNNPDFGEIGYWMNKDCPGYMTNAVVGLVEIARKAGYHTLVAYTKLENDRSKGVLTRGGFKYIGQEERKIGAIRDKFILTF